MFIIADKNFCADDTDIREPYTIVALAPLTEVAKLNKKHIERYIISAGGFIGGDATPAAERRIYTDPEAAKEVIESGLPVYLFPLDLGLSREKLDAAAVRFARSEEGFTYEPCFIGVETEGGITRGKTVTDLYSDKQLEPHNCFIITRID